jgi:hypothetical protein
MNRKKGFASAVFLGGKRIPFFIFNSRQITEGHFIQILLSKYIHHKRHFEWQLRKAGSMGLREPQIFIPAF